MAPDEVRRAYGEMAEQYIELFDNVAVIQDDDLALIERHLGACDGPVLDLGCGRRGSAAGRRRGHRHQQRHHEGEGDDDRRLDPRARRARRR